MACLPERLIRINESMLQMKSPMLLLAVICCTYAWGQVVPESSSYNADIAWEAVFTEGPAGKVNRGCTDVNGDVALVFMPEGMARIHKIDGNSGALLWSQTFEDKVGFGICEIAGEGGADFIVTGGAGDTQERWMARLNGQTGEVIWDRNYPYPGNSQQFDGVRMAIVGEDGQIYGAGFVNGDEPNTIFVVYGGQSMLLKVNPETGDEIWSTIHDASEYALAIVQGEGGDLYTGGVMYEEGVSVSKFDTEGALLWHEVIPDTETEIPSDLTADGNGQLFYGCHNGREGAGDPYDYTCIALTPEADVLWKYHYANPRGYSLEHIRNELYGIQTNGDHVYLFGGSGDESSYSASDPLFPASDVWVGWVLSVTMDGEIANSWVYSHDGVNTATEYGVLAENGFVLFNDTDAGGDTEVGVMKIQPTATQVSSHDEPDRGVVLSPNPASSAVRISIEGHLRSSAYSISDMRGRIVMEGVLLNTLTTLLTDQLTNGEYILRIFGAETVITKPLLIQK